MKFRRGHRMLSHYRQHVRRFDVAGEHLGLVARVYAIDEVSVPFTLCVKVVPEAAIHKWIDYVAESNKKMKVEAIDQQRQYVLRSNPFESLGGAIPVLIQLFVPLQLLIEPVRFRQLLPELVNNLKCFGPAQVAVAADHIRCNEDAVVAQPACN